MKQATGALILTCEYAPFPGGMATYAERLVSTLQAAGQDVRVIAPHYHDLPQLPDRAVKRFWRPHAIGPVGAARALAFMQSAPREHIILAMDVRSVLFAYAANAVTGRPYRAAIHGSEVSKFEGQRNALRPLVQAAYQSAEVLTANSDATLRVFERGLGRHKHGVVNYLGVDAAWFRNVDGVFEDSDLAAIDTNATIVSTVARIEDRKGQFEAVDIVEQAAQLSGRHIVYVTAGRIIDAVYAERVRSRAAERGVRLVMPGRLSADDLVRLYRRSAAHLLPAQPIEGKIEGFGLVLLEAGAQRCPSIATDVGGIAEVIGDTMPVFAPADTAGMAQAIARLINDPVHRRLTGDASARRASSFSWTACAKGIFPELFDR